MPDQEISFAPLFSLLRPRRGHRRWVAPAFRVPFDSPCAVGPAPASSGSHTALRASGGRNGSDAAPPRWPPPLECLLRQSMLTHVVGAEDRVVAGFGRWNGL
jgi:hypothetical protein